MRRRAMPTRSCPGLIRRFPSWRCPMPQALPAVRRHAAGTVLRAPRITSAHSAVRLPRLLTVRAAFPPRRLRRIKLTKRRGLPIPWPAVDDFPPRRGADWGFAPRFRTRIPRCLHVDHRQLLPLMISATAFAPATVSNVACGFGVLGFALDEPGDEVTATLTGSSDDCRHRRRRRPPAARRREEHRRCCCADPVASPRRNSRRGTHDQEGPALSSGLGGGAASAAAASWP